MTRVCLCSLEKESVEKETFEFYSRKLMAFVADTLCLDVSDCER